MSAAKGIKGTAARAATIAAVALFVAACDPNGGDRCDVTPPTTWSAPNWDTHTAEAMGLRARLSALTGADNMRGAETGALNKTLADLNAAFESGTPSLKSASTSFFVSKSDDAFTEFLEAANVGTRDLRDEGGNWTPGAEGGVWTTAQRAFNEGGLEMRQVVEKALFGGATLYNYALGLTTGTITEGTIDALAASFGANAGLNPGRSNDAVAANQNVFSANYVFQMGMYGTARQALIDAKAYAAAENCTAQRDQAIQTFFKTWEQGLVARFVFYSNKAANAMNAAETDDAVSGALHDFAEGLGLALGLYGVADPVSGPMRAAPRRMTDERLTAALDALGVPLSEDLGDATVGNFVSDSVSFASGVKTAEAAVVEAYDLTQQQLASYRAPTDG